MIEISTTNWTNYANARGVETCRGGRYMTNFVIVAGEEGIGIRDKGKGVRDNIFITFWGISSYGTLGCLGYFFGIIFA